METCVREHRCGERPRSAVARVYVIEEILVSQTELSAQQHFIPSKKIFMGNK